MAASWGAGCESFGVLVKRRQQQETLLGCRYRGGMWKTPSA